MLDSKDFDFSFSGIKTSVRYAIEKKGGEANLTHEEKLGIARDFEESVTTVLVKKTRDAVERFDAKTVIIGGGVSANTYIRDTFTTTFKNEYADVTLYLPPRNLSTDNSIMIALTGHAQHRTAVQSNHFDSLHADGNLELRE
jgi:N6-L-threonylcarbamoyladenine synthase